MRWTLRELDTTAHHRRQTARSLQAVDLVLRSHRRTAAHCARADLHIFLREQVIGLVQVEQLLLFDAQGKLMASCRRRGARPPPDVSAEPCFARCKPAR
jgi:hypothetical protein